MWQVFKVLVGTLVVLCLITPIVVLVIRIIAQVGDLIHEWKMQEEERAGARAETRQKQLSWHSRDDKGFGGLVYDAGEGRWYDADTGEEWEPGGRKRSPAQEATTLKQRLLAAKRSSGVKASTPPLAQQPPPQFSGDAWQGEVKVPERDEVEV